MIPEREGRRERGRERDREIGIHALGKCPWSSRGRRKEQGTVKEMGEAANRRREDN